MCWEPSLEIHRSNPAFIQQLESAQASKDPASEKLLKFVSELTARYPDLTVTDDTPWATGPLTGEIGGRFIHFVISWSWYKSTLVGFVVQTGHSVGLHCYDPQTDIFYKNPDAP